MGVECTLHPMTSGMGTSGRPNSGHMASPTETTTQVKRLYYKLGRSARDSKLTEDAIFLIIKE